MFRKTEEYTTQSITFKSNKVPVKLKLVATKPEYKTTSAAGADLSCMMDIPLETGVPTLVDTGVFVGLPEGTVGLVYLRSSLGLQGIILVNGVGVIDPDYRGAIQVCLMNTTNQTITLKAKTRIAQLLVTPNIRPSFEEVAELSETGRGSGCFGSTGSK